MTDTAGLVERLRKRLRASRQGTQSGEVLVAPVILFAAADALEAAATREAKLREALEKVDNQASFKAAGFEGRLLLIRDIARQALKDTAP